MTTKLTLTVEEEVIVAAKKFAHQSDRSLSEMVEEYLRSIVESHNPSNLSPKLKRVYGSIKLPKGFNEKEELKKTLQNKHL